MRIVIVCMAVRVVPVALYIAWMGGSVTWVLTMQWRRRRGVTRTKTRIAYQSCSSLYVWRVTASAATSTATPAPHKTTPTRT